MTLWRDCVCGQVFWQKPEPKGGGMAVGVAWRVGTGAFSKCQEYSGRSRGVISGRAATNCPDSPDNKVLKHKCQQYQNG